jgi:hypothetical protein
MGPTTTDTKLVAKLLYKSVTSPAKKQKTFGVLTCLVFSATNSSS